MKYVSFSRFLLIASALISLAWLPPAALAQHGGGHGGGGFHGGGGGFHGGGGSFHGGGSDGFRGGAYSGAGRIGRPGAGFGGYRGGGFSGGFRGGYRGGGFGRGWYGGHRGWYGGRYWGYPYYGWGWGFGWGWPYWGYPYGYWGYPSYYGSYPADPSSNDPNTDPNNYPYQCPPGYSCIQDPRGNTPQGDPPANDAPANRAPRPAPGSYMNGNPRPWRTPSTVPAPTSVSPDINQLPSSGDSYSVPQERVLSVDRIVPYAGMATPASYRTTPSSKTVFGPVRPEVYRAMRQLHEMPPYAREREISTGRYSQFSDEEKRLLRSVR